MEMQTILALVIVGVCAVWAGWMFLGPVITELRGKKKDSDSSCGGGCGCGKPVCHK